MYKRVISAALAVLLTVSMAAVSASADETAAETSGDATGTFKFIPDWEASSIYFYIWDQTAEPIMYATKDGWTENGTWGSKKTKVEKGDDGSFESFEITFPEGHDLSVIFYDMNTGNQTYDCVLGAEAIGDTAEVTGEFLEAPADGEPTARTVKFKNCGLTARKRITHSGEIEGETITPYMDTAKEVASYVLKGLGGTDPLTDEPYVTEEKVANAIEEFGTTANEVWTKYLTLEGEDNYNAEEAKKVIKPTEDEPETTSDTEDISSKSEDTSKPDDSSKEDKASSEDGASKQTSSTDSGVKSPKTGYPEASAALFFAVLLTAALGFAMLGRSKKEE